MKDTGVLPVPFGQVKACLVSRTLRLVCLTKPYAELWNNEFKPSSDVFTKEDNRLDSWSHLKSKWSLKFALRTSYERRQALVEIDALAALELGITADELCTIYRTQFPVLHDYENNTWYDTKGRIAFTNNRGLAGVGLKRQDFEAWQAAIDDDKPTPSGFDTLGLSPPFDRCDREEDMTRAYYFFADKLNINIPENEAEHKAQGEA